MFLNYNPSDEFFINAGAVIPASYNAVMKSAPTRGDISNKCGVSLVAQYLDAMKFRTDGIYKISDSNITTVWNKAVELDETLELDEMSGDYPTLYSVMSGFINLNYVKNTVGPRFIRNDMNSLKYFIRQYNGIIIETQITSTTHNAHDMIISDVGETLTEDFTKGFIAYGYDTTWLYLQNSLGVNAGSLGFTRIKWDTALKLIIRGAVFHVSNSQIR